jgi:hypothetical protein
MGPAQARREPQRTIFFDRSGGGTKKAATPLTDATALTVQEVGFPRPAVTVGTATPAEAFSALGD